MQFNLKLPIVSYKFCPVHNPEMVYSLVGTYCQVTQLQQWTVFSHLRQMLFYFIDVNNFSFSFTDLQIVT